MNSPNLAANRGWNRPGLISFSLIVATVLVYAPVHRHEFINYDDPYYVTSNPHTQAGLNLDTVRWAFTSSHASNWHPLTWISHLLDGQLFGLNPAGHHLVNVLFHTANVLLLFTLLRRTTEALWRSAIVAALFALHPLHVETVAWVSERKDVLSTFFGLLTLICYAQYVARTQVRTGTTKIFFILALICFALGLLSKPMLVTWPFVLLLLDFWPLRRITFPLATVPAIVWRKLLLEKLPFLGLTIAMCVVTILVQHGSGATIPFDVLPVGARLAQMPVAWIRYLAKTFWPENLAMFYPYVTFAWDSPLVLGAALLMLGVTFGAYWQRRQRPFLALGWFWFLGTLMPVIGLVQVGWQGIADRYTYIPHIGLFIAIVWFAAEMTERIKVPRIGRGVFAALVLAACGVLASRQLAHWQNTGTLARHTIRVTQDNYLAHAGLAMMLVRERKFDEAIVEARTALRIRPEYAEAHNTIATIYAQQGRADDALASYLAAIRGDPRFPDPHEGLAELYIKLGRFADAERESRAALQLDPLHLGARFTFARALHSQNRFDEAIAAYRELDALKPGLFSAHRGLGSVYALKGDATAALREFQLALAIQPANTDAHNSLGLLLLAQDDVPSASNHFSLAVTLEPTNLIANAQLAALLAGAQQDARAAAFYRVALKAGPDQIETLNNFAWLLATSPDDTVRNGAEAVRVAEHGCELTKYQAPLLIGTLAAAYAESGRFDEATATAAKARDLAWEMKLETIAARNEELLQLYRAYNPYREARR
jgi:tetratricopeptide (TPR) repeat protein